MTSLQLLPPQQRAVLVLREALEFSAREVAVMLGTTEQSVTSALKRARATMAREEDSSALPAGSAAEQLLLGRLVAAFEAADVPGILALMTDDAWVRMPPAPLEYQGHELAAEFFASVAFRPGQRYRLIPTRANGQPAFAVYLRESSGGLARPFGLLVITVRNGRVAAITRFGNPAIAAFGLPDSLAA